jgi:arsenate reductase (thioredoxin)
MGEDVEGRLSVLFLCVENACRSQMAEALLRRAAPEKFDAFSAGLRATSVDPVAISVMEELGIDISGARSKSIEEFSEKEFDFIISVCGLDSEESCPVFMGRAKNRLNWLIPDPSVARSAGEDVVKTFRSVRDQIEDRVERFVIQVSDSSFA